MFTGTSRCMAVRGGFSDGGIVGLAMAIHNPERLDRLFIFGANYDPTGVKDDWPQATVKDDWPQATKSRCHASASPSATQTAFQDT
jgi:pimeloyl-ACP methyl ester carboxylesterase